MIFKLISTFNDVKGYRSKIITLFKETNNSDLSEELWNWFYLENSFGEPVVSLAIDNNVVVGHYAVIPIYLKGESVLKSYLSMTTMVHPNYQGQGLFIKLATKVYEHLEKRTADLVFGFPNQNSAHGFKKYLGWKLEPTDFIAELKFNDLKNSSDLQHYLANASRYSFPTSDGNHMNWRSSKPNRNYVRSKNELLKEFGKGLDLISYLDLNFKYKTEKKVQVLLDSSIHDLKKFYVSDYQFGYKMISNSIKNFSVNKNMILSDVF